MAVMMMQVLSHDELEHLASECGGWSNLLIELEEVLRGFMLQLDRVEADADELP